MKRFEDLDKEVLWHPFTQMAEWSPLVISSGEGNFLIDNQGRRYLDGVSSLWANLHGHRHPRLDGALRAQLDRIAHSTFLGLTHEPGIQLAADLIAIAPSSPRSGDTFLGDVSSGARSGDTFVGDVSSGGRSGDTFAGARSGEASGARSGDTFAGTRLARVFYSDSGSTAVEIALKQSFQYWALRGRPTKQRFLRLGEAYHGDTLGAVGVGGIDLFHRVFGPLLVQSIGIPSPAGTDGTVALRRIEEELERRAYEIAAFILEPLVQGAAGMLVHPRGFLAKVAELCRHHRVHLILDEVATGFGRTGTMFACEQEGVIPDFLCLAKGITGGYLPLAATLSTEEIYSAFLGTRGEMKHFFHGHTYTANPLACAVGIESLRLLCEETLANAQRRIPEIAAALTRVSALAGVAEVRQCGLMVGIELAPIAGRFLGAEVCERARSYGVMLRPLGDVVVWMPPLSIRSEEIALLEMATTRALADVLPDVPRATP